MATATFHALSRRSLLGLAASAVTGALVGCVPVREGEGPDAAPTRPVWPPPPAPARFIYETTLRSSADVTRRDAASEFKALVTGGEERRLVLTKPYAVAAVMGIVYVSDTVARRVHAFDLPRGRAFSFGMRREGRLAKPLGVAVDDRQRVYVADVTARRVVMFDHLGLFLAAFGGEALFTRPADVAPSADGSRIYVVDLGGVDSERHGVLAFDGSGALVFRIQGRGGAPGQFNLPVAAAVAPDGTLYVLDAGNFRVQAFDGAGRYLRAWGSVGRGYGQFARPKSIAVDRRGLVYVADAAFGNVQVFDPQGRLLLPIGRFAREDRPGQYALLSGVTTDNRGFVYLLDQLYNKIDVLRAVDVA